MKIIAKCFGGHVLPKANYHTNQNIDDTVKRKLR